MKNISNLHLDSINSKTNANTETADADSYSNYGKALLTTVSTIAAYALWKVGGYSFWSWGADTSGEEQDIITAKSMDDTAVVEDFSTKLQNTANKNNAETISIIPDISSQRRAISSAAELAGNQTLPLVGATEVGRFTATTSITDISIRNNLAYVLDGEDVFYVVDVRNPANPQQLGQYIPTVPYYNFNLVGDYAYIAADVAGVQTIDVSDPSNLVLNGTSMVGVNPESMSASYLAAGSERTLIYNAEQRKLTPYLSRDLLDIYRVYIDTPGSAHGVFISGSIAYVADYRSGLQIIDVSNPSSPQLLGSYNTPANAYDVFVSGSIAYVADGQSGLQIIDVSNPVSPQLLGSYDTSGLAHGVFISGSIAYVADFEFLSGSGSVMGDSGLRIIDVNNPVSPQLLSSYDTRGSVRGAGVFVSGSIAYMADNDAGLQIIDVSNPSSPRLLGSYNTPGLAHGVFISGSIAYVADYRSGLQIIDVSNPSSPQLLGSYNTPDLAYGVFVSGSIAYVADGQSGLQIIDVSNPVSPQLLERYNTPDRARGVFISGSIAYVADSGSGLQLVDDRKNHQLSKQSFFFAITDDIENLVRYNSHFFYTAPQVGLVAMDSVQLGINGYETGGRAYSVYVSDSIAYVAAWDSDLRIIDVSNPVSPQLLGSHSWPDYARGVYVSDSIAYVAGYRSGLQIIGVINPVSPQFLGNYDTPGVAYDVFVSGSIAYVADGGSGLQIIDISNPVSPQLLGGYAVYTEVESGFGVGYSYAYAYGVFVSGSIAYVADGGSGLQIIDVSNPVSPQLLGSYDTPGVAYDVFVSGSIVYVADGGSGLQIIDVSDLSHPQFSESYDTSGNAYGVFLSGSIVYVADEVAGLQIIDTTILKNRYATEMTATVIAATGNYLYLADTGKNLYTLDIRDISNMSELNNYPLTYHARDIEVAGDYLYVAQGAEGIEILDISIRENPVFIACISDGIDNAQTVRSEGNRIYVNDNNQQVIIFDIASLSYLAFSPREITIIEGESHVFTADEIEAEAINTPGGLGNVIYTPSSTVHGYFALSGDTGITVSNFSQQQINDQQIVFIHDGGELAPSFSLEVSDGTNSYGPFVANINYQPMNDAPVLLSNQLTVNEGESTILNLSNIDATDIDNPNTELSFIVRQLTNSRFEKTNEPNRIITRFSYNDLVAEQIRFVSYLYEEDASSIPFYQLVAFDGDKESIPLNSTISLNAAPRLLRNQIDIYKGQRLQITSEYLLARDVDADDASLMITISNLEHCEFHWLRGSDNSNTVVTQFQQSAVSAGEIELYHDNSANPPHYQVQVSDAQITSKNYTMQVAFENRNLIAANNTPAIVGGAVAGGLGLALTAVGLFAANRYTNNLRSRKKHAFANYIRNELNVAVDNFDTEEGTDYLDAVSVLSEALDDKGFYIAQMHEDELKYLAKEVAVAASRVVNMQTTCCGQGSLNSNQIRNYAASIASEVLLLHSNAPQNDDFIIEPLLDEDVYYRLQ